jgi:NIMA (never in mitosis gene a)-related kinase
MERHHHSYNQTSEYFTIVIPLNYLNIVSLTVLFILILFGSYYLWSIGTRKKCLCKVCKGEYTILEKLSIGGFGEIFKVKKNKQIFILKCCKTENITEADDILAEAKYLRNLEHKHIVTYIDDFIHIEFKTNLNPDYHVDIIMEFCEGGDLKKQIDEFYYAVNKFTKKQIIEYLIQICEGLSYLHNKNILHRDIKSQNIFITKQGVLRIGDFGLAKKIKKNRNTYMTKVGTDSYMAPEIIQGETYGKSVLFY